jgi:hypothetical protein
MTKETKDRKVTATKLKEELRYFTGDILRYQHAFNRKVIYTPGVRHLANETQAFWLIDAIASWIGTSAFADAEKKDPRIGSLHFWVLTVNREDSTAVLHAEADKDVDAFIVQSIPHTGFPLDEISIWAGFDGSHWTLYLPSEH